MLQKYASVKWVNNDYALRLVETFNSCTFWWGRTSDTGNCVLKDVKENWSPTTFFWKNEDYAPTFPVYHVYLTSKHSQLAVEAVVLNLIAQHVCLAEYTFGYKTSNQLSEKEKFNLGDATVFSRQVGPMIWIAIRSKNTYNWKNQPMNLTATSTA